MRRANIAAVRGELNTRIPRIDSAIAVFQFEEGEALLNEIQDAVANAGDRQLDQEYHDVASRVDTAKRDHQTKVDKGWSLFEGQFISPNEKDAILAQRKRQQEEREAEAKRLTEEQRRQQEQREAEAKRLEEERRLAEEARKQKEELQRTQAERARRENEAKERTPEYMLATINEPERFIPQDDLTVKRFAHLLDRICTKLGGKTSRNDIADCTYRGWQILHDKGDTITLLAMMEELNATLTPDVAPKTDYSQLVALYVTLRLN